MNFNEIEVISELVNYKSFSDAAYSLSLSPSVITNYVSKVEKELGLKLFIRSKKSNELLLTPEGKILITAIHRINSNYKHLQDLAKQMSSGYENVIRIGSQPRYGNSNEQEIIATFLANNPKVEVDFVKTIARDLMNLLQAGKLDAIFVTIHASLVVEEYYKNQLHNSDIEIIKISNDNQLYVGISEKYLPGKMETTFKELRDFTFAFPFPNSSDDQERSALSTYESMARANGFNLKTMNMSGYDSTAFRLATKIPLAVCTMRIPAQYDGIKFVRVSDWIGSTSLYFICLKNNRKGMLNRLKETVMQSIGQADK